MGALDSERLEYPIQLTEDADLKLEHFFKTLFFQLFLKCFQMSTNEKEHCMDWVRKCRRDLARDQGLYRQYPFVGAAIGIVISVLGVIFDFLVYKQDSLIAHPFLKVLYMFFVITLWKCFWECCRDYGQESKAVSSVPVCGRNHQHHCHNFWHCHCLFGLLRKHFLRETHF